MTLSRYMTVRSTAGAILTLLAIGMAWPSGAQAGCLYAHRAARGNEAAHLERLALAGALSLPFDDADTPLPVPPCAGLRCGNDPAPAPLAAPPAGPVAEQWGDLADLPAGTDITASSFPTDDSPVQPRHRGESPFHPPR